MRCRSCNFENPETMRFCGGCGRPLTEAVGADAARRPAPAEGPAAERRQLTMLFCDIVDSTVISGQLDPEEWRDVVRAYQEVCVAAVERFEGYTAQYQGDGVVAYFGYPRAHEDAAQRAVRAALAMARALPAVNARFALPAPLAIRVAVHTGLVVVGAVGSGSHLEQQALGAASNVASRLQEVAPHNAVVVSAATHRLVRGYFESEHLGSFHLKGVSRPVEVFRILRESVARGRLEAAAPGGLAPFVGRRDEAEFLLERWQQAKEGQGRVVLVTGEAGIGKSRLVRTAREQIAAEPHGYVEMHGSPYFKDSALYPVIDTLERVAGIDASDPPETKLAKVEAVIAPAVPAPMLPLLAALLSLPHPQGSPPLDLSPEQLRQRTLESITAWWLDRARRDPVLFVVEDLQWADPSTLELLGMLVRRIGGERILVLATARPELAPPWPDDGTTVRLALNRLTRRQVVSLVTGLAGRDTLPPAVIEEIVARADGVPLFAEELTRLVLEAGALDDAGAPAAPSGTAPLEIPATLRDSLMARLDRLGDAKEVAQRGAVLGREFGERLLAAVSPLDEASLREALARLVDVQILQRRGRPPETAYRFKHALLQEGAYQSLLRSARRDYHRQTAEALERDFAAVAATRPEIIAHHYTEAGAGERAIAFWQRASRRATARSAYEEAVHHCRRALEVIAALPEDARRAQLELGVQMDLARALMVTRGYASAETGAACERALELRGQVEGSPLIFEALMVLWSFYTVRSDHATARPLAEQCMALAERTGVDLLLLWANLAVGQTLLFTGEPVAALQHLERAYGFYDPERHRAQRSNSTQDPGVMALSFIGHPLWLLGYPDQALTRGREAYALAQEIAHPHSVAYALSTLLHLRVERKDAEAALALAEELRALADEQGFAYYQATATKQIGWALTQTGRLDEGIALIERGLEAERDTEGQMMVGYHLLQLARAYSRAGRMEDARTRWTEAKARVERAGEGYYAAMLHEVEGDLLLAAGEADLARVERCYREAIEVARRQGVRSPELSAALRLARLLHRQDRAAEAHELLAAVYGSFSEGFDTGDLREARALLDDLEGAALARP